MGDVMRRVERILEGKEDDRLFGKREEKEMVVEEVEEREVEDREWYGLHLLPEVPGMEIVKSLGIVHVYSDSPRFLWGKAGEEDFKKMWIKLREKAINKGANAVINVRVISPNLYNYDLTFNAPATAIYIYGEMVIVRPKA